MEFHFENVVGGIYALAVWDTDWKSYNNCYILLREDSVTLIDTGKSDHSKYLLDALSQLGMTSEDVTHIIITHGHADHFGGVCVFNNAKKFIHVKDVRSLGLDLQKNIIPIRSDRGSIQGLDYMLVEHHTEGSIALFEPIQKVLFSGDFLCFFGEGLPIDGLVSKAVELRIWFYSLVSKLSQGEREQLKSDQFIKGIQYLQRLNIEFLCTGHGGVIQGDINSFFTALEDIQFTNGEAPIA